MADNTVINLGSGGDTIATDDVTTLNGAGSAGVKVQRVKNMYGPDNTANDVAYGGNGLPIGGDYLEVTGTASSATSLIAQTDTRPFGHVSVHVTAVGTGTITFQTSNDGTNWQNHNLALAINFSTLPTPTTSATGVYSGSLRGARYFRAQVTSYTSGTFTAIAEFTTAPATPALQPVVVGNSSIPITLSSLSTASNALASSDALPSILDASSARTTSGSGTAWTRFVKAGIFMVDVTAVSGTTPTLTVRIQQSMDNATWTDLDTTNAQTASITATGQYYLRVFPGLTNTANAACNSVLSYYTRLAWTIGGTTPSFTFATRFYALN